MHGQKTNSHAKGYLKKENTSYQIQNYWPYYTDLKVFATSQVLIYPVYSQNKIIDTLEIVEGTVNHASPIIREIFQKALQNYASSIMCVYNHPSGNPEPSQEDKIFTQKLVQAGKVLEVAVLDHIIIGDDRYYSFLDNGAM